MCIYICAYVRVCVYIHTDTHIYIYLALYMYIHTYTNYIKVGQYNCGVIFLKVDCFTDMLQHASIGNSKAFKISHSLFLSSN